MNNNFLRDLKLGKPVVYSEYYTAKEMKNILTEIQKDVPTAWMTRSPSSNKWMIRPA